jgi:ferric-dicitrate binding protein FerR (iron transport regulator)
MTTTRTEHVTPNTSADNAANRPTGLPRRQRAAAAIASGLISAVLLGGVLYGFIGPVDAPAVIAGEAATPYRA